MKTSLKLNTLAALAVALGICTVSTRAAKVGQMDTPIITCGESSGASINIQVCAGNVTGAPAGFSLQWITAEELAAGPDGIAGTLDDNTWPASDDARLCKASFSGKAKGSNYDLGKGQCVTVTVGDALFDDPGASSNCESTPLECGTTYAFRAFAHANSSLTRSDFTGNLVCSTDPCSPEEDDCTLTQGYWKTHGPIPTGNNENEWPVEFLSLGDVVYTDLELLAILNTPAKGNGLISLAHQLIAAKLNQANGASVPDDVQLAMDLADAAIGDLVVPPSGTGSIAPKDTSELTSILANYNEGETGPGHCGPVVIEEDDETVDDETLE